MKYALVIGNSKYDDSKLSQLKTPEADSRALAKILKSKRIGNFDTVTSLIDPIEVKARRTINKFFSNKKPDDLVLLYFSGHGVLDSRGSLFLCLRDTQLSSLTATAISSSFVSYEMDNCRSRRQILILDCCNSGAFARGTKGIQKAVTESTFEGSGSGRVVLTASDSTQFAFEGDQIIVQSDYSLFTHFLLEGLETGKADKDNDGKVSLDEWYDYCHTKITSTTPQQVPRKWSYNQQGELIIAQNPNVTKRLLSENLQLRVMLDQKQLDFQQNKLLLNTNELSAIADGLEKFNFDLHKDDKKLILLSAVVHNDGQKWLSILGNNGLNLLRQAYQDFSYPKELRQGVVRFLGSNDDEQTYKHLLEAIQKDIPTDRNNDWLDLLAHYLHSTSLFYKLPWKINLAVFFRSARLKVRNGYNVRVLPRKIASFIIPLCVIIMMIPVYLQASLDPATQPFGYIAVTIVLGILGIVVAYLFAESMTSLVLISNRWTFGLQLITLVGTGCIIGFVLFYILAGQKGLWFEGGIIGFAQSVVSRRFWRKSHWYSIMAAMFTGLVVFFASLEILQDTVLIEYGAAISTSLFSLLYTYAFSRSE